MNYPAHFSGFPALGYLSVNTLVSYGTVIFTELILELKRYVRVSYTSSVNCIEFPIVSCTISKVSLIHEV